MPPFVLDTDMLSLLWAGHARVTAQAQSQGLHNLAVSVITVEETLTGWYTALR
jgi:hypothetical protein